MSIAAAGERRNDISRRPVQRAGLWPAKAIVRLDKPRQDRFLVFGRAIDHMAVEVEPVVPAKEGRVVLLQIRLKRMPRKCAQPCDRIWDAGGQIIDRVRLARH